MNVRDLMTTDVVTVHAASTVGDVARLTLESKLSGIPVVDDNNALRGLVTEKDLVAKHARVHLPTYFGILGTWFPFGTHESDEDMRHVLAVTAGDIMTHEPVTIGPDVDIDDAATLMVDRNANPIPVVENGRLIGIISRADIIRILVLEERDADSGAPPS